MLHSWQRVVRSRPAGAGHEGNRVHRHGIRGGIVAAAVLATTAIGMAPARAADGSQPRRAGPPTSVAAPEPDAGPPPAAPAPDLPPGTDRYVVTWSDAGAAQGHAEGTEVAGAVVEHTLDQALDGAIVHATEDQAEALRHDPAVATIERDHIIHVDEAQKNPPWNLDRIDEEFPVYTNRFVYPNAGWGITAYVLDSGIRGTHTQFGGRVRNGYTPLTDGNGFTDCNGHGTHVAGTIGGSTYGVAKAISLVNVRVIGCDGKGLYSDWALAMNWVVADHQPFTPAVANMSLGGPRSDQLEAFVQSMVDDGITVVVSAGNDSVDACNQSPAHLPSAITVAATGFDGDDNDVRSSFSNFGTCVDLFAPGSQITSASNLSDSGSVEKWGTSMAAPAVTGAAALILAQNPGMAPGNVASLLVTNASVGQILNVGAGSPNRLLFVQNFYDVPGAYPFGGYIAWLLSGGFSTGSADHTFHPTDAVSRQAMAAFLYRAAGSPNGPTPTCAVAPFNDVPVGAPFCGEIKWLTTVGIASGYAGNLFKPKDAVSRQAMAAFLYRHAKLKGAADAPACTAAAFVDVQLGAPFCKEIKWLVTKGIASGYADGGFHPANSVSRQAMASFMYKDTFIPSTLP